MTARGTLKPPGTTVAARFQCWSSISVLDCVLVIGALLLLKQPRDLGSLGKAISGESSVNEAEEQTPPSNQ